MLWSIIASLFIKTSDVQIPFNLELLVNGYLFGNIKDMRITHNRDQLFHFG